MKKEIIECIENVINIQKANWDNNPYMHGVLNGMLLIESMVKGVECVPYEKPKRYKSELGL